MDNFWPLHDINRCVNLLTQFLTLPFIIYEFLHVCFSSYSTFILTCNDVMSQSSYPWHHGTCRIMITLAETVYLELSVTNTLFFIWGIHVEFKFDI